MKTMGIFHSPYSGSSGGSELLKMRLAAQNSILLDICNRPIRFIVHSTVRTERDLMFIGPCIIVIVEE